MNAQPRLHSFAVFALITAVFAPSKSDGLSMERLGPAAQRAELRESLADVPQERREQLACALSKRRAPDLAGRRELARECLLCEVPRAGERRLAHAPLASG
jgi:hypothetical protein